MLFPFFTMTKKQKGLPQGIVSIFDANAGCPWHAHHGCVVNQSLMQETDVGFLIQATDIWLFIDHNH